jgi:antitoxin (DNA-binding transcriptional repressor) of toxin-antitoxin stability system
MNHFDSPMEIVTVRDLRTSFPRIEKILESGESVEIRKRNKVVGILNPPSDKKKVRMPDFAARMRKIFPDMKNRDLVKTLIEEREA